jgi:hypothetical protein
VVVALHAASAVAARVLSALSCTADRDAVEAQVILGGLSNLESILRNCFGRY